jgi:hypothetical protein
MFDIFHIMDTEWTSSIPEPCPGVDELDTPTDHFYTNVADCRVIKGGWALTYRSWAMEDERNQHTGFRLALDV